MSWRGKISVAEHRFAPRDERSRDGQSEGQRAALSEEQSTQLIGFKPLSVFSLQMTTGPDLSAPRAEKDFQTPEGFAWGVEQLRTVATSLPEVGGIEFRPRLMGDPAKARGWYVPASQQIVIITGEQSDAMSFRTLVHELGHAILHPKGDHHSTPEREVEAESTAFVVCHALGLPTHEVSFPYIAEWAHGTDAAKQLATTGQRILNAATRLLEVLAPEAATPKEAA